MDCPAEHAKYDPPIAEWKCPECGKGPKDNPQGLVNDMVDELASDGCGKLHDSDGLRCYACGYETSGRDFAAMVARKKNLVPCEHCKGKGLVKRGTP